MPNTKSSREGLGPTEKPLSGNSKWCYSVVLGTTDLAVASADNVLCPWHLSKAFKHTWLWQSTGDQHPNGPAVDTKAFIKSLSVFRRTGDGTVPPEPKHSFLFKSQLYKQQLSNADFKHPLQSHHTPCCVSAEDYGAGFSLRVRGSVQTCHWQGWRMWRAPCPCPCPCRHACAYACACVCASSSSSCAHGDGGGGARCAGQRTEPP